MVLMAIASPLVALNYSSIYYIIPPLMVFGLSSPVTLTPILPEMGETVHEMVRHHSDCIRVHYSCIFF